MSVALQTNTGDLDITGGVTQLVTDPVQAGVQTLRNKFLIFLGEWFLDTRVGWPMFQRVTVKNSNLRLVGNLIKQVIISTPPFVNAQVQVTKPNGQRKANASFVAYVDPKVVPGGMVVTAAALDAPYIIVAPTPTTSTG